MIFRNKNSFKIRILKKIKKERNTYSKSITGFHCFMWFQLGRFSVRAVICFQTIARLVNKDRHERSHFVSQMEPNCYETKIKHRQEM